MIFMYFFLCVKDITGTHICNITDTSHPLCGKCVEGVSKR